MGSKRLVAADAAHLEELGEFAQLAIAPSKDGLDVNANSSFRSSAEETKRCAYCLQKGPALMFSKSQWLASSRREKSGNSFRRTREPTASDDLKARFAAYDVDGEPFTRRRCKQCTVTNKRFEGERGLLKYNNNETPSSSSSSSLSSSTTASSRGTTTTEGFYRSPEYIV